MTKVHDAVKVQYTVVRMFLGFHTLVVGYTCLPYVAYRVTFGRQANAMRLNVNWVCHVVRLTDLADILVLAGFWRGCGDHWLTLSNLADLYKLLCSCDKRVGAVRFKSECSEKIALLDEFSTDSLLSCWSFGSDFVSKF